MRENYLTKAAARLIIASSAMTVPSLAQGQPPPPIDLSAVDPLETRHYTWAWNRDNLDDEHRARAKEWTRIVRSVTIDADWYQDEHVTWWLELAKEVAAETPEELPVEIGIRVSGWQWLSGQMIAGGYLANESPADAGSVKELGYRDAFKARMQHLQSLIDTFNAAQEAEALAALKVAVNAAPTIGIACDMVGAGCMTTPLVVGAILNDSEVGGWRRKDGSTDKNSWPKLDAATKAGQLGKNELLRIAALEVWPEADYGQYARCGVDTSNQYQTTTATLSYYYAHYPYFDGSESTAWTSSPVLYCTTTALVEYPMMLDTANEECPGAAENGHLPWITLTGGMTDTVKTGSAVVTSGKYVFGGVTTDQHVIDMAKVLSARGDIRGVFIYPAPDNPNVPEAEVDARLASYAGAWGE